MEKNCGNCKYGKPFPINNAINNSSICCTLPNSLWEDCVMSNKRVCDSWEGEIGKREQILKDAIKCVCTDRESQYGNPEDNFTNIAKLWSAYMNGIYSFDAQDVAIMMALLKIGRIIGGQVKDDNYIDACGYIACAAEIATEEEEF